MRDCPSAPRPGRRSILAASFVSPFLAQAGRAARRTPPTALIVPLSGPQAALGRSMARAAALAQGHDAKDLLVLDDGGTPEGAVAAARLALRHGAGLLLGPVLGAQVRPVLAAAAGRAPVASFSNDRALRESGAFLLGITADQLVEPLLRYARGRGVRRVALASGSDAWSGQVADAARAIAAREGIELVPAGAEAEAVLLSSTGGMSAPNGVQTLCAFAETDIDPAALRRLDGAWLAAPDPAGFQSFAAAFEAAAGSSPGLIAGLAYDAAAMAARLRAGGATDRSALLAPAGFPGVCGAFRLRDDGSASRALAILAIERGDYRVIDAPRDAVAGG